MKNEESHENITNIHSAAFEFLFKMIYHTNVPSPYMQRDSESI